MPRWAPLIDRLSSRIALDEETGCWLWRGSKSLNGYGVATDRGKQTSAHRMLYSVVYGPVPDDLVVDHLCSNIGCVNPYHLEAVTQRENCRRGKRGRTTHCPRGHEYTPENTRLVRSSMRQCRTCHRERERARRAAKVYSHVMPLDEIPVAAFQEMFR